MPHALKNAPNPAPPAVLDNGWALVQDMANACVSCGACMAVCPVYRAGRSEELCARGKLKTLGGLEDAGLSPDRRMLTGLESCLLCGRCSQNCPNQVPAMEGIRQGRELLAGLAGPPAIKRLLLEKGLTSPQAMERLARTVRLAAPAVSGIFLRLAGMENLSRLPAPAQRSFIKQTPAFIPGPKGAPRLAIFAGCVTNLLRPGLGQAMLKILSKSFNLLIPPGQGCCGLPAVSAGMGDLARSLALANLDALSQAKADRIVTACGSCAFGLIEEAPRLLTGAAAEKARELAGKVVEVSQVLAELKPPQGAAIRGPVAVHDPCHLKVGLGVSEEPRRVLELAGAELVPMAGQDECCGGGGLFPVQEPGLSKRIFAPRQEAFEASGARTLATSCSGCFIQWRRGLGPAVEVAHPVELLAR